MKHQHEALTSWASGQEAIWQQRGQSKCKCLLVYGVWPKVPLPPSSARTEPPPRLVCDDCTRHLQSSCQRGVPRDAGGREGATHNLARQVTRYTVLVSTPLVFILLVAPLLQTAVTRIKNIYKILFYINTVSTYGGTEHDPWTEQPSPLPLSGWATLTVARALTYAYRHDVHPLTVPVSLTLLPCACDRPCRAKPVESSLLACELR